MSDINEQEDAELHAAMEACGYEICPPFFFAVGHKELVRIVRAIKAAGAAEHEELCHEEDGDIGIDWATKDRDMLTLSLAPDGRLAYAVVLADGTHSSGNVYLPQEAFTVMRKMLKEQS